jgi:SAM-dependent methyltransferase
MIERYIERQNPYQVLKPFLTEKGRKQSSPQAWLKELFPAETGRPVVLDLGCGEGGSFDLFQQILPAATWHGVDIEASPEVARRTRQDIEYATFDGVNLPYANEFFDLVYCHQVLEHVRYPDRLMPSVTRVLKKGGLFVGSVSYLEPYHSYSIFNFTPYGLSRVLQEAGLELLEVRPGIDSYSLIARQLTGAPKLLNFLFKASPMNLAIGFIGKAIMLPPSMIAFLKIQYCGQFCFLARKVS